MYGYDNKWHKYTMNQTVSVKNSNKMLEYININKWTFENVFDFYLNNYCTYKPYFHG